MKKYLIKNNDEHSMTFSLYWNDDYGWGDIENATQYTEKEMKDNSLPIYGEWCGPLKDFTVSYQIEVTAVDEISAALIVENILNNMTFRPCLEIENENGEKKLVDLEENDTKK